MNIVRKHTLTAGILLVLFLFCTAAFAQQRYYFNDSRDGNKYNAVKIGYQIWMAENLNYNANGSKCYDDSAGGDRKGNCARYGRLYDWETAMKACPRGWHLPSKEEWVVLLNFIGNEAGRKLKSRSGWDSHSWDDGNGNGTDEHGFSALPGGNYYENGLFVGIGNHGDFWSATGENGYAYRLSMMSNHKTTFLDFNSQKFFRSIRCVQD